MKILFNDILQNAAIPPELKSPALAEVYTGSDIPIPLGAEYAINAIGIGNAIGIDNTDMPEITIIFTDGDRNVGRFEFTFTGNGLYTMENTVNASQLTINGVKSIGRLAAGLGVHLGTSPAKGIGIESTASPRTTLSGQEIAGRGGYVYRRVSLDTRYKIDRAALDEIIAGSQTAAMGYPFFVLFDDEYPNRLPWQRLYARDTKQLSMAFESSVNHFLFSRRFEFEERF